MEELYFRAYLLPRLPVRIGLAVPIPRRAFTVQHYWQPHNWPLALVLQLILTTLIVVSRSVRLGVVMPVLANSFGILLTLYAALSA